MIDKPIAPKQKAENKPKSHQFAIVRWPTRQPDGLGLSFKDGWNFGTGFGLALLIAVPVILAVAGFVIAVFLMILGIGIG